MTDKQVRALVHKWQRLFWLEDWGIGVMVFPDATFKGEDGKDWRGQADVFMRSRTANLSIAGGQSDEAVLETVQHELCHVLIKDLEKLAWWASENNAVREQAAALSERIVRQICHALQSTRTS